MNHSFIAAPWNAKVCIKCTRNELAHSDTAICEACSNVGPCELVGKILMCASCQVRDTNTAPKELTVTEAKPSLELVINQVNRLLETDAIRTSDGDTVKSIIDDAIKGNIKEFKDFFNAKLPSIMELKSLIDTDESIPDKRYALAAALGARVKYLGMVLFQFNSHSIEVSAEVKSIQQYMNSLIPQLRMEQRTQFAANDINFVPQQIKAKSAPKVRTSTTDKLAENYAKLMGVTVEQAKLLIARRLKPECSCAETPGMCKVHKS